ncbi:MAG: hypothetical protein H6739_13630 [Alphaproteobacteria bacterium]|nr:hypothetical protein [Alphaproteobacteria bacterium]
MRLFLLIASLCALVACNNPCQDLCKEIASYAEDCNITVPDTEPGACIDAMRRRELTAEDRDTCRDNAEFLRDEWTCADVELYFDNPGGGGEG